jgi:protein TonB
MYLLAPGAQLVDPLLEPPEPPLEVLPKGLPLLPDDPPEPPLEPLPEPLPPEPPLLALNPPADCCDPHAVAASAMAIPNSG